jgi:RimJ/RimL family protein N-acetyltransferase
MTVNRLALKLETERLRLRPFQDSDAHTFAAYRSDPEVARYQGWDAPYSLEQATRFIAHMKTMPPIPPGEWYQLAIEVKDGDLLAGDCAFHTLVEDPQQAEIGFTLARAYQGMGYGREAITCLLDYLFGELHIQRVQAICDAENAASIKLLERVGMKRETQVRENVWFKGYLCNEYVYALSQPDTKGT